MILKLQSLLLSLPMLAVNAKKSQVLHSSGRKSREAKRAQLSPQVQEHEGFFGQCREHGSFCFVDGNCCGEMECLGIVNFACGYTPGREGEDCNFVYPCGSDLLCYEGVCTDYADILDFGEFEGTCKEGSPVGELTLITYNTFLLSCPIDFVGNDLGLACQGSDERAERVGRMMEWVATRDEDVVVFQELYNLREQVIEGMVAAGFCHYVVTPFGQLGDGTAIFSKHPINEIDFWDYFDLFGCANSECAPEIESAITDRGIMWAEIMKDGISHQVYNTHTLGNSNGEQHLLRLGQYMLMKEAALERESTDPVYFAGDLNEDKFAEDVGDQFYQAMLQELNAFDPELVGDQKFSYDNVKNTLTETFQPLDVTVFEERLDYALVSNAHLQPSASQCEILTPVWPEDCGNEPICQISDHYPVTCKFTFAETPVAIE